MLNYVNCVIIKEVVKNYFFEASLIGGYMYKKRKKALINSKRFTFCFIISVMLSSTSLSNEFYDIVACPEEVEETAELSVIPNDISKSSTPNPTNTVSIETVEEDINMLEYQFNAFEERQNVSDDSFFIDDEIYESYVYPLSKIIYAEAGNLGDLTQQYVGYVVMNRVNSIYFPDTIEGVFFKGRAYAESSRKKYRAEKTSEAAIENATVVIEQYFSKEGMPVSPALVYQAQFEQGEDCFQMETEIFGHDSNILRDLKKLEEEQ